jgi:tungstate transport system substrate-binding protein
LVVVLGLVTAVVGGKPGGAEDRFITVASTTSTDNSGLFGHILPIFESETGIEVRVVAVGTGQAIRLAERGDADVLLVHHKPSEEKFVAGGYGVRRFDVMYNDFVVVGPRSDPAGIRGMDDAADAMAKLANAKAMFASRGDNSGTHKKELGLWRMAGVYISLASGSWYRETGSGMGATLNTASGLDAYTLADRATWISFRNKGDLEILVEGDARLFNQYGVILVSSEKHPHVKAEDGRKFIDWLVSPVGQNAIARFEVDGQRLFHPNAKKEES